MQASSRELTRQLETPEHGAEQGVRRICKCTTFRIKEGFRVRPNRNQERKRKQTVRQGVRHSVNSLSFWSMGYGAKVHGRSSVPAPAISF
eukprot:1095872-Rhodomonas_salina.1